MVNNNSTPFDLPNDSNIYLAHGIFEGHYVMKVGATYDVKKRQSSLALNVETWRECSGEFAREFEDNVRNYAIIMGARKLVGHTDYFVYDPRIFAELKYVLKGDLFFADAADYKSGDGSEDREVAAYRERYRQMARGSLDAADYRPLTDGKG